MRRILLPTLLITFMLTYALIIPASSYAYELNDPDAQAMAHLIKGDIDSITIIGKQTWDIERLFVAVAQTIPGVKQVSTSPTTETREELDIRIEQGEQKWYWIPVKIDGYIGYVSTKPFGLFWKHKAFLMLPRSDKRGVDIHRTEIKD